MADALVLGGGLARGAFTAGAVAELRRRVPLDLRRVVGASSGALCAAFLSARPADAERLVDLWVCKATWGRALAPDVRSLASLRGLSSGKRVHELVESELPRVDGPGVPLRIVATDAHGVTGSIDGKPATSFERLFSFDEPSFVGDERSAIINAVLASAAFPFMFAPNGTLLDGGALQNTPIKHALGTGRDVDRIFVIAPYPRVMHAENVPELRGLGLVKHLADMMVHEPLYRDLCEAAAVNRALRALPEAAGEHHGRVLEALGWTGRRIVEVVEIRPAAPLPGNAFAGFFDVGLRREYVALGREAAVRALLPIPP